jgi:hypothetical protein
VVPYWGTVADRKTLRKFWAKKAIVYDRDAPFHIIITSYNLIVTDSVYLKSLKWQYMILDEAQAIKSSSSARWNILLDFHCRNRLLLTGTPIQNSMQGKAASVRSLTSILTTFQSSGLCCILSCLACSIHTTSSPNGSRKTLKAQLDLAVAASMSTSYEDCI